MTENWIFTEHYDMFGREVNGETDFIALSNADDPKEIMLVTAMNDQGRMFKSALCFGDQVRLRHVQDYKWRTGDDEMFNELDGERVFCDYVYEARQGDISVLLAQMF